MAHVRQRGENSYEITVSCGYDSAGKKLRKTKSVSLDPGLTPKQREKELQRQAHEFESAVERGSYLDGGKITFAEFTERWFRDYADKQLQPMTIYRYKSLLPRILPAIGHIKLDKLQPVHLLELYDNLREEGMRADVKYTAKPELQKLLTNRGITVKALSQDAQIDDRTVKGLLNGKTIAHTTARKICDALGVKHEDILNPKGKPGILSDVTIRHHHRLISSILSAAVQWQVILSNPADRVKPPKVEKKEAAHYDEDQTEYMLSLLEKEPLKYAAMINVAVYSGCRLGELAGLEWSDLDFDNNLLRVRQSSQYLPGKGVFTKSTKNASSERIMAIPPILTGILKKYKVWQGEERLKLGDLWQEHDRVFTQWNGLPIHPSTPTKWFKSFRERHNLPALKFHGLRHTNATLLIGQGIDTRTVAGRLGHSTSTTTQTIYSHFLQRPDKEAAEKLEKLFGKKNDVNKKRIN